MIFGGLGSTRVVGQINLNSDRLRAVMESVMPPGIFSFWHLLILLVVVLLVFGTKKVKNIGQDLGDAVKGFRSAMASSEKGEESPEPRHIEESAPRRVAEPPPSAARSKVGATPAAGDRRSDWPNS